jgi:hypothetical protein
MPTGAKPFDELPSTKTLVGPEGSLPDTLGTLGAIWLTSRMNYRTKAEYFIQGITQGFVEASEVIAWSDEVVAVAPKTEDWMIEISSCGPNDRMAILSHLNTVKGVVDQAGLSQLLKAKGAV